MTDKTDNAPNLETHFASPLRLTPEEIIAQAKLLEADDSINTIFNAIPEFVMILNCNRQIVFGNETVRNFAKMQGHNSFLGMRPGELLSCQHALITKSGCGTAEACRTCGAIQTILKSLKGFKASQECRILRGDAYNAEALDFKVWGTPFYWKGETFMILVAVDISSEKRRHLLERIFFHDVMNTAGAIRGITDLLIEGDVGIEEIKEDLQEATESLINEIHAQRQLLAAENNELDVSWSDLRAKTFLESVIKTVRNHQVARDKHIVIAEECKETEFVSDSALLGRVISNLLKNALEASAPSEYVTLGSTTTRTEINFWCHNPSYIPRNVQLQIFQRSYSTKGKGRGIGTYSIKLLVERYLKGHVSFVSSVAMGTIFTVTCLIQPDTAQS